jgi:hypothetical protein
MQAVTLEQAALSRDILLDVVSETAKKILFPD